MRGECQRGACPLGVGSAFRALSVQAGRENCGISAQAAHSKPWTHTQGPRCTLDSSEVGAAALSGAWQIASRASAR